MLKIGDRLDSYTLAAGEPWIMSVQMRSMVGNAIINWSQRRLVLSFYDASRTLLDQIEGVYTSDATGAYFAFIRDGRFSEAMFGKSAQVELAERLQNGRAVIATGALSIVPSSLGVTTFGTIIGRVDARFSLYFSTAGLISLIEQELLPYGGASVPPPPAVQTPAAINSDGTPQVDELLTGLDPVFRYAAISRRRWVKGSTTVATVNGYRPTATGELTWTVDGLADDGSTITSSSTITVAAANAPTILFDAATVLIPEGDSGVKTVPNTINVTRSSITGPLTVNLSYSGTATSGVDYVAGPVSGTIADGQTTLSFDLIINGDTAVESGETIVINAALAGYSGATASKTITIGNDDAAGAGPAIGGVTIGTVGADAWNTGLRMSDGIDFTSSPPALSTLLMTPSNPYGQLASTLGGYAFNSLNRTARSSTTLGGYESDPFHTGYLDSNKGVAVPSFSDMITLGADGITLKQRDATTADQPHMIDPNKKALSSSIHFGGRTLVMAPFAIEAQEKRHSNAVSHITFWIMQALGYRTWDDFEADFESQGGATVEENYTFWNNGVGAGNNGQQHSHPDDVPVKMIFQTDANGYMYLWSDNGSGYVLRRTLPSAAMEAADKANADAIRARVLAKPYYSLHTNHVLEPDWTTGMSAATQTVQWVRVWSRNTYYSPVAASQKFQAAFGAAATFNLPSQTAIWGATGFTETLAAMCLETNEPGGRTLYGSWELLPPGVTWDSAARTVAIDNTIASPGRLHLMLTPTLAAGTGARPWHFVIDIGPNVTLPATIPIPAGGTGTYDIYQGLDCGQILPKIIAVTGLPPGATINTTQGSASYGVISYNNVAAGSYPLSITVTNANGQSVTVNRTLKVNAAAARSYATWTGPGWFDASDTSLVVDASDTSLSNVTSWTNKRSSGGNLTKRGTAGSIKKVAGVQNGKSALRLVRNLSNGAAGVPHMAALATDPLSLAFSGADHANLVIFAYNPTDTVNNGFVYTAAKSLSGDVQSVGYLRRRGTGTSDARRSAGSASTISVPATPAGGDIDNTPIVVAIRFTGTTVTIWHNSLTPFVVDAPQDTFNMASDLIFRLFASSRSQVGGVETIDIANQTSLDLYEMVVEADAAKSNAEVQTAITDMAAYWGITLS